MYLATDYRDYPDQIGDHEKAQKETKGTKQEN
jgi:hypothetical protein